MTNKLIARPAVGIGLIALTTLVAYIPAYRAGFIWDDDRYVTRNPTLQTPAGLQKIWLDTDATPQYYPLAFTSFWIENHLWGLSPVGYHIVNILLHIGCAILLWRLLLLLAIPGALLAAMLFALHPLHVESVAWITERKNVLSGLFYLAAMLMYFRWTRIDESDSAKAGSTGCLVLAVVFFVCAMLSKSVTATLPAAILLILWWKRGRISVRDSMAISRMFEVGVILAGITVFVERTHVGTEMLAWNLGPIDRLLIAGRAACFYLGKLFWPAHLTFIYPRWGIERTQPLQWIWPLAVIAALVVLFALRRRSGRGPLAAALFYLGTLLPALGFVMVYPMRFSFVADHFCYLASIGPIVFVSALLMRRTQTTLGQFSVADMAPSPVPIVGPVFGAIALCVLGMLTFRQTRIYDNLITLWQDTLDKNPDAWVAHNNLGLLSLGANRLDEAADHFAATARLFPDYPEGHNNLGNALLILGRLPEAEVHLKEALRLIPSYAKAHYNLGRLRERQGQIDEAIAEYRATLDLNAFFVQPRLGLVQLMMKQGKSKDALAELDDGLKVFGDLPDAAQLHKAKGAVLLSTGRAEEAIAALKEGVRRLPSDAELHLRLANALFQAAKLDEAATVYVETLAINSNIAQAHYNLGVIRISQNLPQEGFEHFEEAVRLKPDYLDARFSLAQLMEAARKPEDATSQYREVLRLDPNHADAKKRLEALMRRMAGAQTTSRPSKQ